MLGRTVPGFVCKWLRHFIANAAFHGTPLNKVLCAYEVFMTDKPTPYKLPGLDVGTFNCPNCRAYSKQRWGYPAAQCEGINVGADKDFRISRCDNCQRLAIWIKGELIHPASLGGAIPNSDLSDEVKADFSEARKIVLDSPRGAAALLRLAVQKICVELGQNGKNINDDIASLVENGLPPQIQQALDVVRVVGNNAVHPGSLDMKDDVDTAERLFSLVNLIAEVMISQPKHVQDMYDSLVPDGTKEAIEKRDGT
jgi:hypothetical protein